ncbi:leucine-rich PPR motif-containing protein, mitochondrial isoform X2 [Neocloeon triangulifer]|uniref:leucine-rich PPR motif-containing protein, mitochondrial isoform X2 n=1 Tax=Neocloeon triangulifer TaxID=2078957 RepID=UPI00286F25FF|nr:leucine-rich PPR motif-containing protein, mitochondrial isoform X2 [Neocloeon triangulifer]XP_059481419.1 leucine-rich PPR motif-containing protein, mitochondrial isoform X2 [Neocloeon triangulifer]
MSSLLRSCKFVRFLAGITRNISFGNGGRPDTLDVGVNHNPNLYRGLAIRALATQQNISLRQDSNLDKSLKRIDQEARRAGRVSKREIDEILEEIKQTRSATSSQSLMVIRCCGNLVPEEHPEVRTKLVQEIWNTLESLGVPMDISHYNALLRVYLENGHKFEPSEFLSQLEKKGVEPNRVTYQRLVAQHCQKGDMDGATKILQVMREKQMPINEAVFNALITGHSQNSDMESARGILSVMKQAGLEPGPETYTALLCGHAKQGDIEAIRAVLTEAESQNIEFLDRDFFDVIFSLSEAGHVQHVDEIMGLLKKRPGFGQECVNIILRLVNIGQEDVGKKLLSMMPASIRQGQDGPEAIPVGSFFVKQLVKANRPVEKVISICEELQNSGANTKACLLALEMALVAGKEQVAYALMHKMKEQGTPLRQHFFWPLLVNQQKKKSVEGLCQVLVEMQKLGVPIKGETIREYVIDALRGSPLDKINLLRSCGVSIGSAAVSVVVSLLENENLAGATEIVSKVSANYPHELIKRPLGKAFGQKKNTDQLVTFIQHAVVSRNSTDEGETEKSSAKSEVVVGDYVIECLINISESRGEVLHSILKGLVDCGLSISVASAEKLQDMLGSELTPEISELLGTLTSGNLEPQAVQGSNLELSANMSIAGLETLYTSLQARGQPTRLIRKNLLIRYCRTKNLEKAEEIKKSLDDENFVHSVGTLALLMDLYASHNKLEEALEVKKIIQERDPDMTLDNGKLVRLALVQMKAGKFEDGLNTLKSTCEHTTEDKSREMFYVSNASFELLNYLAEQKEEEKLKSAMDILIASKAVPINNVLLGCLVKVKLLKDDLPGAMEQFKWCCEQHRATPWKSELTRRLISSEDAASLQKLTDLSTQVHGEVNSLYDLVFAFVECGRIRQARRILETPGLRARTFRMNSACERFCEDGKSSPLEGLLEATKDLHHVDRSNIFLNLLKLYCKNDETDKALDLWTQAQEEDFTPSEEFLSVLGSQLKKHNMEIPFSMPEVVKPIQAESKPIAPRQSAMPRKDAPVQQRERVATSDMETMELRQALRRSDVDKALELKNRIQEKGKLLVLRDYSLLIENLVNKDRVGEAYKITKEMLHNKMFPMTRVFRYLLNKVAAVGDIDGIVELGDFLDDEQKRQVSYDNRLGNAYLFAGKANEYLDMMSANLNNAKSDDDVTKLAEKFPRGSALGILTRHPELTDKLSGIAESFAEKGHPAAFNVLWMHYFASGRYDEAGQIWDKYLSKTKRLMFQHICQQSRRNNDPILCSNLLGLLLPSEYVSAGAKGNVLSCLIDVLVNTEKYEDAVASITASQKDIGLEYINSTALLRLKTALEAQGKVFPFTIPPKRDDDRPVATLAS